MNIAVATEATEVTVEEAGARWTLDVRPLLGGDLVAAGFRASSEGEEMVAIACQMAAKVKSAVSLSDGGPVTVNDDMKATDPKALPLIFRACPRVMVEVWRVAMGTGEEVEGQRGNSDAAPA